MTATQSQTGPSDMDLVHAFVRSRDQGAFTQLVRRHVDMVYATALRRVRGDRHAMSSTDEARTTDDRWDEVEPLLDGAMDELGATDRAAVVMRFHHSNRSSRPLGAGRLDRGGEEARPARARKTSVDPLAQGRAGLDDGRAGDHDRVARVRGRGFFWIEREHVKRDMSAPSPQPSP